MKELSYYSTIMRNESEGDKKYINKIMDIYNRMMLRKYNVFIEADSLDALNGEISKDNFAEYTNYGNVYEYLYSKREKISNIGHFLEEYLLRPNLIYTEYTGVEGIKFNTVEQAEKVYTSIVSSEEEDIKFPAVSSDIISRMTDMLNPKKSATGIPAATPIFVPPLKSSIFDEPELDTLAVSILNDSFLKFNKNVIDFGLRHLARIELSLIKENIEDLKKSIESFINPTKETIENLISSFITAGGTIEFNGINTYSNVKNIIKNSISLKKIYSSDLEIIPGMYTWKAFDIFEKIITDNSLNKMENIDNIHLMIFYNNAVEFFKKSTAINTIDLINQLKTDEEMFKELFKEIIDSVLTKSKGFSVYYKL